MGVCGSKQIRNIPEINHNVILESANPQQNNEAFSTSPLDNHFDNNLKIDALESYSIFTQTNSPYDFQVTADSIIHQTRKCIVDSIYTTTYHTSTRELKSFCHLFVVSQPQWKLYFMAEGVGEKGDALAKVCQEEFFAFLMLSAMSLHSNTANCFENAFVHVQYELESKHSKLCVASGVNVTLVLKTRLENNTTRFIVANTGENRVYVAINQGDGKLPALTTVSKNHSTSRMDEKDRVRCNGGEVKRILGDSQERIFFPNANYPGFTYTRIVGCTVGKKLGIIVNPEIVQHNVGNDKDAILIVGSTSLWDYLTPLEISAYVLRFQAAHFALEKGSTIIEKALSMFNAEKKVSDDFGLLVDSINVK